MASDFNKMLSDMLGKMDDKVMMAKLNKGIEKLLTEDEKYIKKKIEKIDKNDIQKKMDKIDKKDLIKKLDEFDESKLKELNINKKELQQKLADIDLDSFKDLFGEHGDEIIAKVKDIIK
jgi:N-methylhydantoinase B/oxoprolinase/acetone carboxylase alpha subunit